MSSKCLQNGSFTVGHAGLVRRANSAIRAVASTSQSGSDFAAKASRAMRVGFIGLDCTGKAMASRLIKAGHRLKLYDPARKIPEALKSAGASLANCIEDACRWADVVFTMLHNDEVAEAVILGPGGVVEALPRNSIHIGSSTISLECSDRIVEAHWDAGREYVSAPVLVRPASTAEEQLLMIAGGREATIIQMEPLLGAIGQVARLSGWPSDANLVQLGGDCVGANLFQFLARHPELRARQHRSPLARPASPSLN